MLLDASLPAGFEANDPPISRYRAPPACDTIEAVPLTEGVFLILPSSLDSSEKLGFSLLKPVSPESLGELGANVSRAVADGIREVTIDVDDIGILDSVTIAALITIRRQAREGGASVTLQATRKNLDTLRVTALSKVFTIVSVVAAPPPPPSRVLRARLLTGVHPKAS
jgi:ABC-type transporter Mla MlaB component